LSDFESSEFNPGASDRAEREGLPAGYRMRADAHYVELLSGASRPDRAAGRPATDAAPPARSAAVDARERRFLQQLSEDLAAIESAARMLATDSSPLARRVGLDLIRAQSARASWLIRARALDGSADDAPLVARPLGGWLTEVRDRLSAECRLVGVRLELAAVDSQAVVVIDRATATTGLVGAVLALVGVAATASDPLIRLSAEADGDRLIAVEVSHRDVACSGATMARFFDADWADRPGGWLAAMGARTARIAAERLGGTATVSPADGRSGCAIRLSFA
jgi:hypothetical protein